LDTFQAMLLPTGVHLPWWTQFIEENASAILITMEEDLLPAPPALGETSNRLANITDIPSW
jgi:hypothetical protein